MRSSAASKSVATPSARSSRMSWIAMEDSSSAGVRRTLRSDTTRKPMASSSGTRCDNGTSAPRWNSFSATSCGA